MFGRVCRHAQAERIQQLFQKYRMACEFVNDDDALLDVQVRLFGGVVVAGLEVGDGTAFSLFEGPGCRSW